MIFYFIIFDLGNLFIYIGFLLRRLRLEDVFGVLFCLVFLELVLYVLIIVRRFKRRSKGINKKMKIFFYIKVKYRFLLIKFIYKDMFLYFVNLINKCFWLLNEDILYKS